MMIPLEQFICDNCGQIIEKPEDGWFEWIFKYDEENSKSLDYGFKIVHHKTKSPQKDKLKDGCYFYTNEAGRSDMHLHHLLDNPIPQLLSFLDVGPYHEENYKGPSIIDMREFVEIFRRLLVPFYEEARLYWEIAVNDGYFGDANEIYIYLPETLENLIKKYGQQR